MHTVDGMLVTGKVAPMCTLVLWHGDKRAVEVQFHSFLTLIPGWR